MRWPSHGTTTEIAQMQVTEDSCKISDPEGLAGPDVTHSSSWGIQCRSPWPGTEGLGEPCVHSGIKVAAADCEIVADSPADHWGRGQAKKVFWDFEKVALDSSETHTGPPTLFLHEPPLDSTVPLSSECQSASTITKSPESIKEQADLQMPPSGKKKLTISLLEKEKLLKWDLDIPEEPETQDTAVLGKSFDGPSDEEVTCEVSIASPVAVPTSAPAQSQPDPPQSTFQLVANALRRSFVGSSTSSTISLSRRNRPLRSRPPSEGSFKLSSLFWGKTGWAHNSKGGGQKVDEGPSPGTTTTMQVPSVLELPELLENVSLREPSGRVSRDDTAILSPRNLNYFSSMRLKKPDRMKKRVTENQENDIWSMVSNLRQKVSSQEQQESSSSSGDESTITSQKDNPSMKQKRRQERTVLQQTRQEQLKRLLRAQVIQRQLEEVEERQRVLEEKGVTLEKRLRGETDGTPCDEAELQTWYKLVQEKNRLTNYESELMIFAQELELEDTQSQLQQKLRRSMAIEDSRKSPQELSEEQQMFAEMMRVVEKRDALVALLEEKRLSESANGRDLESIVHQFHWT